MDVNREIVIACEAGIKELEAIRYYSEILGMSRNEKIIEAYFNNRMDELSHIQNIVVTLTALHNGEEPPTNEESFKIAGDRCDENYKGEKQITVYCTDNDNQLQELLEYIKDNGNGGHSFPIIVDGGDSEKEKAFYWDGDGSDHVYIVETANIGDRGVGE